MAIYYRKGDTEIPGGTRSQGHFIVSYNSIFRGRSKLQAESFADTLKAAAVSENNTAVEVYKNGKLIGKAWDFTLSTKSQDCVEFWGDFTEEIDDFYQAEMRTK